MTCLFKPYISVRNKERIVKAMNKMYSRPENDLSPLKNTPGNFIDAQKIYADTKINEIGNVLIKLPSHIVPLK